MLPSTKRISKVTFKSLGRGVSYPSPLLTLFVYKKTDQSKSQFSFSCSKKVAKSAVKRNLLRRRGYNAIQKIINAISPGFYFVFSFKKGAELAVYKQIESEIQNLLQKAGVLS